jgi:hypothetical protein
MSLNFVTDMIETFIDTNPRTKSSLLNAQHYSNNEKARKYRTNSHFRQEPNWS